MAVDSSEGEALLNTCPAHLLAMNSNLTQCKLCIIVILPASLSA